MSTEAQATTVDLSKETARLRSVSTSSSASKSPSMTSSASISGVSSSSSSGTGTSPTPTSLFASALKPPLARPRHSSAPSASSSPSSDDKAKEELAKVSAGLRKVSNASAPVATEKTTEAGTSKDGTFKTPTLTFSSAGVSASKAQSPVPSYAASSSGLEVKLKAELQGVPKEFSFDDPRLSRHQAFIEKFNALSQDDRFLLKRDSAQQPQLKMLYEEFVMGDRAIKLPDDANKVRFMSAATNQNLNITMFFMVASNIQESFERKNPLLTPQEVAEMGITRLLEPLSKFLKENAKDRNFTRCCFGLGKCQVDKQAVFLNLENLNEKLWNNLSPLNLGATAHAIDEHLHEHLQLMGRSSHPLTQKLQAASTLMSKLKVEADYLFESPKIAAKSAAS